MEISKRSFALICGLSNSSLNFAWKTSNALPESRFNFFHAATSKTLLLPMLSTDRFASPLRTFKSLHRHWSLNLCFKETFFLKSAINSDHWLCFPSEVITSIGVNCQDSNSWCSAFITVRYVGLLMGSIVSSPSKGLSINSLIGSAKGLILSNKV